MESPFLDLFIVRLEAGSGTSNVIEGVPAHSRRGALDIFKVFSKPKSFCDRLGWSVPPFQDSEFVIFSNNQVTFGKLIPTYLFAKKKYCHR